MTEHPRPGEASWQNSLVNFAGAPDPPTSLAFAATAAKFARVAPDLAPAYREAALRAWDWADVELRRLAAGSPDEAELAQSPDSVIARRALAAVELLWLTGEARFQEAFAAATVLTLPDPRSPDLGRQRDATFTYARLPEGLGDPALRQAARTAVTRLADYALTYGDGNSFGLSTDDNMPPMGWVGFVSKPGIHSRELPRAYYLTGDPKYLSGAIRACQFALGANPENLTFTTGLGPNPVRWPLHIDSQMSGQPTPPGITVCGNSDPAMNYEFDAWAHTWFLAFGGKMVPDSRTWPMYESYWDIYTVPSTNEYQPHFLAQSAYYWGFLAARPPLAAR
jgi:endoglucanase